MGVLHCLQHASSWHVSHVSSLHVAGFHHLFVRRIVTDCGITADYYGDIHREVCVLAYIGLLYDIFAT